MKNNQRLWKVTGTLKGIGQTVKIRAANHSEAVGKGSRHPHMLCVNSCVLLDE